MPECVGATLSANGHFLVLAEEQLDNPDPYLAKKVTGATYHVVRAINDPNRYLKAVGPNRYWAEPKLNSVWSVHFSADSGTVGMGCSYLFVTDDAEFVIFLEQSPAFHAALHIYHRREHPGARLIAPSPDMGVLVRDVPMSEIIPNQQPENYTDHTPQWYSEGTWSFSPDNRTLEFRRTTGDTVRIDLATGTVRRSGTQ